MIERVLSGSEHAHVEHGDALTVLRTLPDECVQTIVTSPPYWHQRDYGIDGQIGLEKSISEYTSVLTAVFAETMRVLRSDGTLWVNIGDTYAGSRRGPGGLILNGRGDSTHFRAVHSNTGSIVRGRTKDLLMIPAKLVLSLQEAGWWLRSEIVWHKTQAIPESVIDRPTRSHEMIYLFSKRKRYFYDAFAIREPVTGGAHPRGRGITPKTVEARNGVKQNDSFHASVREIVTTRNSRSVWTFASEKNKANHFAVFPSGLPRRCILAGTSEVGACARCGAPRRRLVKKTRVINGAMSRRQFTLHVEHLGWTSTCSCGEERTLPCVVLDPFSGTGTTGAVALGLGRRYLGIELNPKDVSWSRRRLNAEPLPLSWDEV